MKNLIARKNKYKTASKQKRKNNFRIVCKRWNKRWYNKLPYEVSYLFIMYAKKRKMPKDIIKIIVNYVLDSKKDAIWVRPPISFIL